MHFYIFIFFIFLPPFLFLLLPFLYLPLLFLFLLTHFLLVQWKEILLKKKMKTEKKKEKGWTFERPYSASSAILAPISENVSDASLAASETKRDVKISLLSFLFFSHTSLSDSTSPSANRLPPPVTHFDREYKTEKERRERKEKERRERKREKQRNHRKRESHIE